MKLTPSILTASDSSEARFSSGSSLSSDSSGSSLSSDSSLPRTSSDSSASSLASSPRNRAPLVGASIKGSVTPSPPRNRTPLVVASEKGSVTPSIKGSVTQRERTAFFLRLCTSVGSGETSLRHADRCGVGHHPVERNRALVGKQRQNPGRDVGSRGRVVCGGI